jgi:hypothetical protein
MRTSLDCITPRHPVISHTILKCISFPAAVTAAASLAVAEQASAIGLPWQESTGGMVKGGGNSPKSATRASMESYTLEGTKKQGITAKSRKKMLAAARKKAAEAAS